MMDRISSLPDEIISHVLSFLSIKKVARTSVLSKRWRILFAFSSNLDLSDYKEDKQQIFVDFVNRVLAVSGNSSVKKFTLRCRRGFETSHINRWIRDVLNRGVLVLDLDLGIDGYSLPFEVFTLKTVVNLKLTGFFPDVLPHNVFLPALETFFIYSPLLCHLQAYTFVKLLSVCPALGELVLSAGYGEDRWEWIYLNGQRRSANQ